MAFSAGGGGSRVKSDINVTPLVDVCLVLLIIFLATLPVMLREIPLEVPKKPDPSMELPTSEPLIVTVSKEQAIQLNGSDINRVDLAVRLRELLATRRDNDRVIFVDFDAAVPYGEAVSIMDTCKGAGKREGSDSEVKIALKMRDESAEPSQQ